jgi:hypothetical protein
MKIFGLLVLSFLAATVSAQTNQGWPVCRQPVRIFAGQTTVNLTPLFEWWAQQPQPGQPATNADNEASRPLAAWKHVTGLKVGELGTAWLLDAVIHTSPTSRTSARIILNNPPAAEEQLFNSLKSQLAAAPQQITNEQRAYETALKAARKADKTIQDYRRSGSKQANEGINYYSRVASQKREAAAAAQTRQKQLEDSIPEWQKQLDTIPTKNGKYLIDWFALEVGRNKQGVPVYDLGVVPANSP